VQDNKAGFGTQAGERNTDEQDDDGPQDERCREGAVCYEWVNGGDRRGMREAGVLINNSQR